MSKVKYKVILEEKDTLKEVYLGNIWDNAELIYNAYKKEISENDRDGIVRLYIDDKQSLKFKKHEKDK